MPASKDALGDWRGLHGTHYHLIYAIWLLICDGAARVAFYEGNDLRVLSSPQKPSRRAPPQPSTIGAETLDHDVWIQLKATHTPWSASGLCRDNLLANFVVNAITSIRSGRKFVIRLVSQAMIDTDAIPKLRAALRGSGEPADKTRINDLITAVQGRVSPRPTRTDVIAGVREVLNQLQVSSPVFESTLEAEVERDLALLYPDHELIFQIKNALMGALLKDVKGGPSVPRAYDQAWLQQPGVPPLRDRGLLDSDPSAACGEAMDVVGVRPRGWSDDRYVPRAAVEVVLNTFLTAPEPLLVVTGGTGVGVSWALYKWARHILDGRVRLLIPGQDLDQRRDLASLVSRRLGAFRGRWTHEMVLSRLCAVAARASGRDRFVLVIDGIPAPTAEEQARLSRALAELVTECVHHDVKVVLSCHSHVWSANRLGSQIPLELLYRPPIPTTGSPLAEAQPAQLFVESLSSIVVEDLTPDESTALLERALPSQIAGSVDAALRGTAYRLLGNVSLLARYIDVHRKSLEQGEPPPIPRIDSLLEESVDQVAQRVSTALRRPAERVKHAIVDVARALWRARPDGLAYDIASTELAHALPDEGMKAYDALVDAGLLTPTDATRFTDGAIAEHLYAQNLLRRYDHGDDILSELHVELDGEVVAAMLRAATDPMPIAEPLLTRDDAWLPAVVDGLAQRQPGDRRILALVTALMHPNELTRTVVQKAAARALGTLAARDADAYRELESMYLGNKEMDSYRAAQALATTINLVPDQVEGTVQRRLTDIIACLSPHRITAEYENSVLQTLTPIQGVEHRNAVPAAQRLLSAAAPLAGVSNSVAGTLARLQGNIALLEGDAAVAPFLTDLNSPDAVTRLVAVQALRPVATKRPELVCDALCLALTTETDPQILLQLLWTIYRVADSSPEKVLDALAQSTAVQWTVPQRPSPTALALLVIAVCGLDQPRRAFHLLPQDLSTYSPEQRALLADVFAYATWCCAQGFSAAVPCLHALSQPVLGPVPAVCHPFALHGAAIAQLGSMRLALADADALHPYARATVGGSLEFLTLVTTEYAARHGAELAADPQYRALEALLLQCIGAAEQADVGAPNGPAAQALYSCASDCLVLLSSVAVHQADPVQLLQALPREWQALHVARRLLEGGRHDPPILAFAQTLCEDTANGGTAQASDERRRLLAVLLHIQGGSTPTVAAYRSMLGHFDFGGYGLAIGFAEVTDREGDTVLQVLHEQIATDGDLPILYRWKDETQSWRNRLLAIVYRRMFDADEITVEEAHQLIQDLHTALDALPPSDWREDYLTVYGAIAAVLDGHLPANVPMLHHTEGRLGRSHAYALSLLTNPNGHPDQLTTVVLDAWSLWATTAYSLSRGDLSVHWTSAPAYSSALYYVFPAVRLALVALGVTLGCADPVAQVMAERKEADRFLEDASWVDEALSTLATASAVIRRAVAGKITSLRKLAKRMPQDERLWYVHGNWLLRLGRFNRAEVSLSYCRTLLARRHLTPLAQDTHATVLYDLACLYARTNRPKECRRMLRMLVGRRSFNRSWMRQDPDLVSVRPLQWFRLLSRVKPWIMVNRRCSRALGRRHLIRLATGDSA